MFELMIVVVFVKIVSELNSIKNEIKKDKNKKKLQRRKMKKMNFLFHYFGFCFVNVYNGSMIYLYMYNQS